MKKKRNRNRAVQGNGKDTHHLLFQGRHWKQGYARLLRESKYFKVEIPKNTLHRELHSKLHDLPTPNGVECRLAYQLMLEGIASGKLDPEHDTAEKRLEFLIEVWQDKCPATVAMLSWQRDIIHKFFEGGEY